MDALVATSPVNVTYFTDYYCWLDPLFKEFILSPGAPSQRELQTYAVFPLEGEPALVVDSPLFAVNAADIWVQDLHIFGDPGMDHSLPLGELSETEARFLDLLSAPQRHATPTDSLLGILKDRGLLGA